MSKKEKDSLKTLNNILEEYSPENYSVLLALPILLLVIGFLIWNFYLYSFGFIEDEILRTKFIPTGLCFVVTSLFFWFILNLIKKTVFNFLEKEKIECSIFSCCYSARLFLNILIITIWFSFYLFYVFPILPSVLGGGQPRALSLLVVDKESLSALNSLNIHLATGAINQTENLCIVHENSQGIYVIRKDRILMLDRSLFRGFGSLGGIRVEQEQECIRNAVGRFHEGSSLSIILLVSQVSNLVSYLIGQEQYFFQIK